MKIFTRMIACLGALTALSGVAAAAEIPAVGPNGEIVSVSTTVTPRSGSLYRTGAVPANLAIKVEVKAPYNPKTPGGQDLLPSKNGTIFLPKDLEFRPRPGLPACSDAKMNPGTNLSILPADAIKLCPGSVIGNGTADLYLAHKNLPGGPSLKAVVVIFHAGLGKKGRPKIKIYGFSKDVRVGLLMQGSLRADNSISIDVPFLPTDSALGRYELNVPGTAPITYQGLTLPGSMGLDPGYVRARCSSGSWAFSAISTLGTRDTKGDPLSPDYRVRASDFTADCHGLPGLPPKGKARIGKLTVKGPSRVRAGKAGVYRVAVKNPGVETLRDVRVDISGVGKRRSLRLGSIGGGKTGSKKMRIRFRQKGRVRVRFRAGSENGGAKQTVKRVRVR